MNRLKNKLKTIYRKNEADFKAILLKRYPEFVFKNLSRLSEKTIPIFVFHSVIPEYFESQIEYLALNDYRTLNSDELYQGITGKKILKENTVVLTFDDGCGSLWTTAYPILKKYCLSAICFLVPYWIKKESIEYPTVEELWKGKAKRHEVMKREISEPLCTWNEIVKMHESGVVDFQSHTSYHHSVFVSNKLDDFINPELTSSFLTSDLNPVIRKSDKDNYIQDIEWGQPVYRYAPSMSSDKRYLEDTNLSQACISFVNENGGRSFFSQRGWRSKLLNYYQNFTKTNKTAGRYQSAEERYNDIFTDLVQARRVIEEKLNKEVRHLCYPWYAGSMLSVKASNDAGYLSNYWGIKNKTAINSVGQDTMYLSRLNDEYIFALPGKGRKSLIKILAEKARRLQSQDRFKENY